MVTPLVALKRQTMQYLVKHRNRFYYKRKLPKTQNNLVISLQTDNKSEANYITAIINARITPLFKDISLNFEEEIDLIQLTIKEYVQEAKDDYSSYSQQREEIYKYTSKNGTERLGSHPKAIEKAISNLTDSLYSSDKLFTYTTIVTNSNMQEKFINTFNTLSAPNKNRFIDEVIKGEIEILHLDKARNEQRVETPLQNPTYLNGLDMGQIVSLYNTPYQVHTSASIQQEKTPINERHYSKTVQEVFESFKASLTSKEKERTIRDVSILINLIDKEYLIDYTHEELQEFSKDILFLPDGNIYKSLYTTKSYKEIIAISKKENYPPLGESTLANKVININSFLNYAVDNEFLDRNRLKSKSNLSASSDDDKRKEYYTSQLNDLFTSEVYTSKLQESFKERPSDVWMPLILLYTGCRSNEIAQIYLEQITEEEGIHFFKIEKKFSDQQLKNPQSKRTIPIHPILIELGILKLIESQREKGYERLFQELYHTAKKGYGQAYGKRYNDNKKTWLDKETLVKLKNKEILLDLHSFRHNFSGSLKGLIEDGILDYLSGHKNSSLSQSRYGKFRPKLKYEMICKCEYENLNLDVLKTKFNEYYEQLR